MGEAMCCRVLLCLGPVLAAGLSSQRHPPSLSTSLPAPRSSCGHPGRGIGLQRPRGPLSNPAPDPGLAGLLDSGVR